MLSKLLVVSLSVCALAAAGCASSCASPSTSPSTESRAPETAQLDEAVALALADTVELREQAGPCRVIGARQYFSDGKWIWRITMKPVRLLPDDPSTHLIGAGGEIFVNVDLPAGTTSIGFGE